MSTHDNNEGTNGDTPEPSAEAPDWHSLDLRNPDFLRLALVTIEERAREAADENRKGLKDVARLTQDTCTVANKAFGEASRAREAAIEAKLSAERVEAALAISTKIQTKMARTMGIETPDSTAPPPFRERFDSLQGEIDLAEIAAAEARAHAVKLEAEVASTRVRLEAEAKEIRAAAAAAASEASGATRAAGEAKMLNTEAVTSLKAIAVGVGKGVAALAVIGSALYGALQLAKQFVEQVAP